MRHWMGHARVIAATVAIFLASVSPTSAVDDSGSQKIDPESKKVLDGCAAYFESCNSIAVTIATRLSTESLGEKAEQLSSLELTALRPNKLAVNYTTSVEGASRQWTFSCDGARCAGAVFVNRPTQPVARYAILDAPSDLNMLIRNPLVANSCRSIQRRSHVIDNCGPFIYDLRRS